MHFRHRQTDGLASWHKREMYILHLALKMKTKQKSCIAHYCKSFYIYYVMLVLFVVHIVRLLDEKN